MVPPNQWASRTLGWFAQTRQSSCALTFSKSPARAASCAVFMPGLPDFLAIPCKVKQEFHKPSPVRANKEHQDCADHLLKAAKAKPFVLDAKPIGQAANQDRPPTVMLLGIGKDYSRNQS